MSPTPDDLTTVKDDMVAFIEGHGMRRFHGYVDYDEVQCIMWETGGNPDGWKDFVELAKASGAPFLTMHSWTLERPELDELVQRLTTRNSPTAMMWKTPAGFAPILAGSVSCSWDGRIKDRCFCAKSALNGMNVINI